MSQSHFLQISDPIKRQWGVISCPLEKPGQETGQMLFHRLPNFKVDWTSYFTEYNTGKVTKCCVKDKVKPLLIYATSLKRLQEQRSSSGSNTHRRRWCRAISSVNNRSFHHQESGGHFWDGGSYEDIFSPADRSNLTPRMCTGVINLLAAFGSCCTAAASSLPCCLCVLSRSFALTQSSYSHTNSSQITAGFTCCVLHADHHKVSQNHQ